MKMLGQHYTTKHKNKEELLCSKCPYKTFADRYFKNHMKTHMEVFFYKSEIRIFAAYIFKKEKI